jgi:hypothetical protein
MMKSFADQIAQRPWSVVLALMGSMLTAVDIWWLVATYRGPHVRVDPEPQLLGIPIIWIAIGVFLLGPMCLGTALYRLVGEQRR